MEKDPREISRRELLKKGIQFGAFGISTALVSDGMFRLVGCKGIVDSIIDNGTQSAEGVLVYAQKKTENKSKGRKIAGSVELFYAVRAAVSSITELTSESSKK